MRIARSLLERAIGGKNEQEARMAYFLFASATGNACLIPDGISVQTTRDSVEWLTAHAVAAQGIVTRGGIVSEISGCSGFCCPRFAFERRSSGILRGFRRSFGVTHIAKRKTKIVYGMQKLGTNLGNNSITRK
jgi:hypothetical protein